MSSHGHGKNMRCVSTTVPIEAYRELDRRAKSGGWKSTTAYIRAVIVAHCRARQALATRQTEYTIPEIKPARAAEPPADYDPKTTPLAPACCPLARVALSNKGNGEGEG